MRAASAKKLPDPRDEREEDLRDEQPEDAESEEAERDLDPVVH